jgi:hypothetical protein
MKWGHLNDAVADGGLEEQKEKKVAHDETRTDTRPTRKMLDGASTETMCQYLNSNEVSFHKSCEKKEDK